MIALKGTVNSKLEIVAILNNVTMHVIIDVNKYTSKVQTFKAPHKVLILIEEMFKERML